MTPIRRAGLLLAPALAAALALSLAGISGAQQSPENNGQPLSAEEKRQVMERDLRDDKPTFASPEAYFAAEAAWVQQFARSGRSTVGLEEFESSGMALNPEHRSFAQARAAAAQALRGRVRELIIEPGYTVARVEVTERFKGDLTVGSTIEVLVPGGPRPDGQFDGSPGYSGAVLVVAEHQTYLQQGSDVVLLLRDQRPAPITPDRRAYSALPVSGQYDLTSGKVKVSELQQFDSPVRGRPSEDFLAEVRASE